jgi:Bacterial PH domain
MPERSAPPAQAGFRIARWLKWTGSLVAPVFAAGLGWLIWQTARERQAGQGWENVWLFAFVVATLAGLALLFLAGLAEIFRARLELRAEGLLLRSLLRTRTVAWKEVAGYRWIGGKMHLYLVDRELPLNLGNFEGRERLYAWFRERVPDLDEQELAAERREIREDPSLGLTEGEKAARLAELRRIVRPINWSVYVAAALGGANAVFIGNFALQAAAACVLIVAPFVLLMLALAYPGRVRLGHREGSAYADGLSGVFWGSLILGLMSLMDPHTLLGVEIYYWTAAVAAGFGGLWLYAEWARLVEHVRSYVVVLAILGAGFFSGLWAGGTIYQVNTMADFSAPAWGESRVTELRERRSRAGKTFTVKVAPWSASREPVELDVPHETYRALRPGMAVELGVRAGLLGIPWVETVRPKR